jgi:hypothetical protein
MNINIFNVPKEYDRKYIETHRIHPLFDKKIESIMHSVISGDKINWNFLDIDYKIINSDLRIPIFSKFKENFQLALMSSKLNKLTGFEKFPYVDICLGCTQYIDSIHVSNKSNIQIIEKEYAYHRRLNPTIVEKTIDTLEKNIPLVISLPHFDGSMHVQMEQIMNRCLELYIPVHIDAAWITAVKNINFDFSHPAIESFAISMSKGYGLSGWNRIGLRWSKTRIEDLLTIMNDYGQITTPSVIIGNYFLENIPIDHLWNTHSDRYYKICDDFNLTPTDSIHLVKENGWVKGIGPLIRYLENNNV